MVRLKVDGRDLWVRPEHIIAFGTGPSGPVTEEEPDPPMTTLVTIAHLGTVPIEQDVSVVREMVGSYD